MSRSMATEKTGGERAAPTPHADHRHSSSSPILFISGGRPQLYPTNEARSDERIASTEIAPVNGASSGKLSAGVGAVAHVALATAAAAGCHSNHGHVRLVHPLDAAAHDAADPHSFLSSGEAAAAADGGTKCGAAACGGGDTAHVLTYKQADDGTILIDASQLPGISGHLQGVMLDQKGNVFLDPAALDPHFFYEPVQATDWAPGACVVRVV